MSVKKRKRDKTIKEEGEKVRKMDGKNNERKTMKGIKQDAVREEKKLQINTNSKLWLMRNNIPQKRERDVVPSIDQCPLSHLSMIFKTCYVIK